MCQIEPAQKLTEPTDAMQDSSPLGLNAHAHTHAMQLFYNQLYRPINWAVGVVGLLISSRFKKRMHCQLHFHIRSVGCSRSL